MGDETGGRTRVGLAAAVVVLVITAAAGLVATAALAGRTDVPPPNPYAATQFGIGLTSVAVGAYLAARRPRHPMGWLLLVAGAGAWFSFAGAAVLSWMVVEAPDREPLGRVLVHLATPGWIVCRGIDLVLVPQAFPDGFRRSRPARALLAVSVGVITVTAVAHSRLFTFEYFNGEPAVGTAVLAEAVLPWGHRALWACALVSIVGLIVRTARAGVEERRRTQWFTAAMVVLLVPVLLENYRSVAGDVGPDLSALESWALAALPLVLAVGILRHGLFDLQVVVRRATVYVTVTAVALGLYALAVWTVSTVLVDRSAIAPLVGAGVVAATLSQVVRAVQNLTARYLFGNRDDPAAALAALGARLEVAPANELALQTLTDTVADQLRLPYAAVDLRLDDVEVRVAETGDGDRPEGSVEAFALTYKGIGLGRLLVATRTPDEAFTDGERRLLTDLARQAGVLAHNASLTEALRHSRAVLLNAREEERRRIRADLHDGLGPTLATVSLGLGAASERIDDEPELTGLLQDLEAEVQTAIADVRALVYDLRPAALDDLGLVPAVREHAENLARRTASGSRPLDVVVEAPSDLDPLPAAVEVAAYRVALEALTNVSRHARASRCRVRLVRDRGLTLAVEDDGIGLPDSRTPGIGLHSMRERVEELGGRFRIEPAPGRGTVVSAWFPLPAEGVT